MQGIDRYIKTKKLDPLVSYVPVLLIAQSQLDDVPLAAEELGIDATRSLLRKGAFDGLRDNVRAVGEYASAQVSTSTAQAAVKRVFASFDALDKALLLVQHRVSSHLMFANPQATQSWFHSATFCSCRHSDGCCTLPST